jgi:hypothetical protein
MRAKPMSQTSEERRIDRELKHYIRVMGTENKAMLLLVAREATQPGTMNKLLFDAKAL